MKKLFNFNDKNGNLIEVGTTEIDDDVLYNGEHYYRIYFAEDGSVEMIGYGYIHNVTQEILNEFIRIGKYKDNEKLLEVD